tara:strand:+ start:3086 stop:5116 length:2031 start_codon:yes stop_codon:yes gene_type:complete
METVNRIQSIIKREGDVVNFDEKRIYRAVFKATISIGEPDKLIAQETASKVIEILNQTYDEDTAPTIEDIQDVVEQVLINQNLTKVAKAYILYRQERTDLRKQKEDILGLVDTSKLSPNAVLIAKQRYLLKDKQGIVVESPLEMFQRVAKNIASAEKKYVDKAKIKFWQGKFYNAMAELDFIPSGRILASAGTNNNQLLSSFVVPLGDSTKEIFKALYDSSIIKRYGGGVGFSFSKLRKRGKQTAFVNRKASGPIAFMNLFDHSSRLISVSGQRKGANMGSLSVEHPDILDFITAKTNHALPNFNVSVEITDNFMRAVLKNADYPLIDPSTKEEVDTLNARKVFDLLITMAWKYGDPGILFIDTINKNNPHKTLGDFETTDPCGDQPLLPYTGVSYGAINLANFVQDNNINWAKLKAIIPIAVRFLDNVIDVTKFPINGFKRNTLGLRNVGLGILGFADMLYSLGIPYNSRQALKIAEKVMSFIQSHAHKTSSMLAEKKGNFPYWEKSIYGVHKIKKRNATLTTISPCGARGIIANTSGGIEPHFALGYYRRTVAAGEILYINPVFEKLAKQIGIYSSDLMRKITSTGSIHDIEEIPDHLKKIFVTAHDISPEWHIRIQSAFQKYVDNAISKTINFPYNASIKDVEDACLLAFKLKCKGITVYRDGSREDQIISTQ